MNTDPPNVGPREEDDRSTVSALRTVGRAVRSLRRGRGLTQVELGERAELDRSYIGGVERGRRNLSVLALSRLLSAMGVGWAEFAAEIDRSAGLRGNLSVAPGGDVRARVAPGAGVESADR